MTVAALALRTHTVSSSRPTFAQAAEANLDAVYRYLRQLTGNPHLAEDLTSETFERALRVWSRYDPARGPGAAMARHDRPADRVGPLSKRCPPPWTRTARRRRADTSPREDDHEDLPPHMTAALATLTQAEREVVALRVLLDLDGAEAASVLGITPSACSTQLHRAMTKLRKELGP